MDVVFLRWLIDCFEWWHVLQKLFRVIKLLLLERCEELIEVRSDILGHLIYHTRRFVVGVGVAPYLLNVVCELLLRLIQALL